MSIGEHRPDPLTFVTVVFEPELALLRLQARSLRRHLDADAVAAILVLDNCAGGMGARARRTVLREFGPLLSPRVQVMRTSALGVRGSTEGWRSQQAAKLLVSGLVQTAHYVILDAKNHLIAPVTSSDFVDDAGQALGATHPYTEHPLRRDLERTLRQLGADEAQILRLVEDFPPTATPFVVDTALARRIIAGVEAEEAISFAAAFEHQRFLEFFLYSGWSILREHRVPVTGDPIHAPIIWPGRATQEGAATSITEAQRSGAAWFSVHRRVLWRADRATRAHIASFWADRGLMRHGEARRFIRRFRFAYLPATARARIAERVSRLRGR